MEPLALLIKKVGGLIVGLMRPIAFLWASHSESGWAGGGPNEAQ